MSTKNGFILTYLFYVSLITIQVDTTLLETQCKVRCLTVCAVRSTHASQRYGTWLNISHHEGCSSCLEPCAAKVTTDINVCQKLCQDSDSTCLESCRFLAHLGAFKSGSCPVPAEATYFEAACVNSCQSDADCLDHLKCCPNECGFTCRNPAWNDTVVPEIPTKLRLSKKGNGRKVKLSWRVPATASHPVVYLIEQQKRLKSKTKWKAGADWEIIVETMDSPVEIRIAAGWWLRYRIAAINANGTRGYSAVSRDHISFQEVKKPSPPQNLTTGNQTTLHDNVVMMTIQWRPPRKSDMPIIRYKVFWSKRLSGVRGTLQRLLVSDKCVPGNTLHTDLDMLLPGTTYFIQVEAISFYKKRLKSNRASMYMDTYAPLHGDILWPFPTINGKEYPEEGAISVGNITVGRPYYHTGNVRAVMLWDVDIGSKDLVDKYLLYWAPEDCYYVSALRDRRLMKAATTHDKSFGLYDLQSDCLYTVKVQAVDVKGNYGFKVHSKFHVPPCLEIPTKGLETRNCPKLAPHPPGKPRSISYLFVADCSSIALTVKWKAAWSPTIPVISYTVAVQLENTSNAEISRPQVIHISANSPYKVTFLVVHECSSYDVRLWATSTLGAGNKAQILITKSPSFDSCKSNSAIVPSVAISNRTTLRTQTVAVKSSHGRAMPIITRCQHMCSTLIFYLLIMYILL